MDNSISMLPLSGLHPDKRNVRKVAPSKEESAELKASILAHGIINNLVVSVEADGWLVSAGKERLKALKELVKEDRYPADYKVPCRIVDPDASVEEISLAENTMRTDMHAADLVEAIAFVHRQGRSVEEIATRFGQKVPTIEKYLRLGTLHKTLLKQYRDGNLKMGELEAFTLAPTHKEQLAAWKHFQGLDGWQRSAFRIREFLVGEKLAANSGMVKYVGLANYKKAGGTTTRNLFAEMGDETGEFIDDQALLEKLADAKLQKYAERLKKREGWKWVEIEPDYHYDEINSFDSFQLAEGTPTGEEVEQLDAISDRINQALEDEDSDDEKVAAEADEKYRAACAEHDALEKKIGERSQEDFTAEQKAASGVIVNIAANGQLQKHKGLIRKEDEKEARQVAGDAGTRKKRKAQPKPVDPDKESAKDMGYSQAVLEDMQVVRGGLVKCELRRHPVMARDFLLYQMCRQLWTDRWHTGGLDNHAKRTEDSKDVLCDVGGEQFAVVGRELAEKHKAWMEVKRGSFAQVAKEPFKGIGESWATFRALPEEDKQELLAWVVAAQLRFQLGSMMTADPVWELMCKEIAPDFGGVPWSKKGLWGRLPKIKLVHALEDVCGAEVAADHKKDKKGELADFLERIFTEPDNPDLFGEGIGLSEEQQKAVRAWKPEGFEVEEPKAK